MTKYTPDDITALIQQDEGAELEFKQDDAHPEGVAKAIVAFANQRGGKLLLSVHDNGEILGLTKENIKEWIMDTVVSRHVKPFIEVVLEMVKLTDKQIAVVEVPPGIDKPYALVRNDREDYYIRQGATSQLVQRPELIRLFESGGLLHSEEFSVPNTSVLNLDDKRVRQYFFEKLRFPPTDKLEELLKNHNFLIKNRDDDCVSIFAFALFGKNIRLKLPQAGLRFTVYQGKDKDQSPLLDEQLSVPVVEYSTEKGQKILEPAIHWHPFFQSHLSEEKIIDGTRRRIWHYPPEALRELIVNALVHRDWTKNNYVRVVAYSNRLEIISPGALYNGMSIEKMKQGVTESRNPRMMRIMRDYGYVEQQGMGIRRTVIPQMLEQNGCEPIFNADEDSFTVILYKGIRMKQYLDGTITNDKTYSHFPNEIFKKVKGILEKKENLSGLLTNEDKAERVAFLLTSKWNGDTEHNWGTYYSPLGFFSSNNEGVVQFPRIDQYVDENKLNYWIERAGETKSFLLKSHYADLVVDFSPKIMSKKPGIDLIRTVIDANIKICELSLLQSLFCQQKIKRALDLAIRINDKERIENVKTAIIQLEKKIPIASEKAGLWGYAFKWLMLDYSHKVNLSAAEKKDLITDLKARLKKNKDYLLLRNGIQQRVCLLIEYYFKKGNEKEFFNILDELEKSIKNPPLSKADNILKHSAYEDVLAIYKKYRDRSPKARKAFKRLENEIGEIDLSSSIQSVSIPINLEESQIEKINEQFETFCKDTFGENNQANLKEVLTKMMFRFLPAKESIKKSLEQSKRDYLLTSLFSKQIIGSDGRPVSRIPAFDLKKITTHQDLAKDENYDINLVHHYSQSLHFQSAFLSPFMVRFKQRFSSADVLNYFQNSFIFKDENPQYLKMAIDSYWENKHLIASHLFIPLIERNIRNLIKKSRGGYQKANNTGGYDYLSLNKLLENNESIFNGVYQGIGESVLFCFRVTLTEKAGLNWRNHFAHGVEEKSFFYPIASDRLFHILSFLLPLKSETKNN